MAEEQGCAVWKTAYCLVQNAYLMKDLIDMISQAGLRVLGIPAMPPYDFSLSVTPGAAEVDGQIPGHFSMIT